MKKLFTLCLSILLLTGLSSSNAATIMIEVEDFEFNPAAVTVNTGDTIIWMWDEGSHTTTSTLIPNGAAAWNSVLNSTSPVFIYIPVIPGSYDYVCSPHASMGMTGHFTVINTSGVSENILAGATLNSAMINNGELLLRFNLPSSSTVSVILYNAIGNVVSTLITAARKPAGSYEEKFLLPSLKGGVYVLQLHTAEGMLTKRVLIP